MSQVAKKIRNEKGIYLVSDVCEECRVSDALFRRWKNEGKIPSPTLPFGARFAYSKVELDQIRERVRELRNAQAKTRASLPQSHMEAGLLSKTDLAKTSGVSFDYIKACIRRGYIPEPTHDWLGKTKYWPIEQKAKLKAAVMKPRLKALPVKKVVEHPGFVARQEVMQRIQKSGTTLIHHEKRGAIPKAEIRFPDCTHYVWYTAEQAQEVIDFFEKPRVPEGFVSVTEMATELKITKEGLNCFLRKRKLPRATHTFPGVGINRFFTTDEADLIRSTRLTPAEGDRADSEIVVPSDKPAVSHRDHLSERCL